MDLHDFIRESWRIEGIDFDGLPGVLQDQIVAEHKRFLGLETVTPADLEKAAATFAANGFLRNYPGMDVVVGGHFPPHGGPRVLTHLESILEIANKFQGIHEYAYRIHHDYEELHPFMDGNGRTGRLLWLWMMNGRAPLGFLHTWYYMSLSEGRRR